ncbi:MAG: AbrB/MazE/SpoVT family DNA-binding domain-containing protein [Actinobacteria bacterium]|nr:AbrB/MazE/SpoVT family DNA-binding domain-containing protein [Actinomycetota bacterium]
MTAPVSTSRVSNRGQTSLPAALRHRWGIDEGGEIAFVDLGDAALVLPGGSQAAMTELRRVLHGGGYDRGVSLIDDPALADQ